MTTPESPSQSLTRMLAEAVAAADVSAMVRSAADTALPVVLLFGSRGLPCALDRTAIQAWLTAAGIDATVDATAADNANGRTRALEIVLSDSTAGQRLADQLLAPVLHAQDSATRLRAALDPLDLSAEVVPVRRGSVTVNLSDPDDLRSAITLAAALGVDDIVGGLDLVRAEGQNALAGRMKQLLIGIVGAGVMVEATPDCVHAEADITLTLSADQALRLTERLT
ncbi:hypothetical protein [Streptomyces sp. NPDC048340]|uniref:hypothetical protein n=1 Tax=Streptomyces sp. NPDC048340 TaxID=3365537 RepID=UPI003711A3DA